MTAQPGGGLFNRWEGVSGCAVDAVCQFTVTGPGSVRAYFQPPATEVHLTFTCINSYGGPGASCSSGALPATQVVSNPTGIQIADPWVNQSGMIPSPYLANGQSVTISVLNLPFGVSANWGGACQATVWPGADCTFNATGIVQVSLELEIMSFLDIAQSGPNAGHGIVTSTPAGISLDRTPSDISGAPFPSGVDIALAASPDPGFEVERWGFSCNEAIPQLVCTHRFQPAGAAFSGTIEWRVHVPVPSAPADGAAVSGPVPFSWTSIPGTVEFQIQIDVAGGDFTAPVVDQSGLTNTSHSQGLQSGIYEWKVRAKAPSYRFGSTWSEWSLPRTVVVN